MTIFLRTLAEFLRFVWRADFAIMWTYSRKASADRRVAIRNVFPPWISHAEQVEWLRFAGRQMLRMADGIQADSARLPVLDRLPAGVALEGIAPGVWLKQFPRSQHRPWPTGVDGPTAANARFVSWDEWCDALDAQPPTLPRLATDLLVDDDGHGVVAQWDYNARRWMMLSREDAQTPFAERTRLPKSHHP